ncbi:MAG: uridine kinase [Candidatus Roseilinea sp.]|uniref:uridine kinase n=1 Tax=Candidatus Roseilinea sp. TaxID=2838777 RepID=UPI00404A59A0
MDSVTHAPEPCAWRRPIVVGVAGGTGSGKTTLVRNIVEAVGAANIVVLQHDAYYRDHSDLRFEERARLNYDHPDALETELFVRHLEQLIAGQAIDVPVYDFVTHTRRPETIHIEPHRIILVEGILVLAELDLRALMDIKLFVDTDADVRFIRRLERDMRERGRSVDSIIQQYLSSVKPMHEQFVEPSKRYADIIIPEGGYNSIALDMVIARLRAALG